MENKDEMNERPRRVQRQRKKGWRMPPNTKYAGRPSKLGNPFCVVMGEGQRWYVANAKFSEMRSPTPFEERDLAIGKMLEYYREWLGLKLEDEPNFLEEYRGCNLACFCALDEPCHVDVILEFLYGLEENGK